MSGGGAKRAERETTSSSAGRILSVVSSYRPGAEGANDEGESSPTSGRSGEGSYNIENYSPGSERDAKEADGTWGQAGGAANPRGSDNREIEMKSLLYDAMIATGFIAWFMFHGPWIFKAIFRG